MSAPDADLASPAQVTLDYLLQRLRHRSDFPALSTSVARIQAMSHAEQGSLSALCDEILKDVALTHKLLRLVNSAAYRRAGADPICTVSRAVGLMGLAAIRNLALSLMLVEHMKDKHHARQLKEEFLRAVMAGVLASELSASGAEAEEAFIEALFRHLGRLLVQCYLPEEAQEMRGLMVVGQGGATALSEPQASQQVLGLDVQALGLAVGRSWELPETLLQAMQAPVDALPTRSLAARPERHIWVVVLANEAAQAMLDCEPDRLQATLTALGKRFQRPLDLPVADLLEAAGRARQRMGEWIRAAELDLPEDSAVERWVGAFYVDAPNAGQVGPDAKALGLVEPGMNGELGQAQPGLASQSAADLLGNGIQDVTLTMMEPFQLNDVLQMILETLYRALHCQRVVFCLRDARQGVMVGRVGLGRDAEAVKSVFRVPVQPGAALAGDLLASVCHQGVDTLIADTSLPAIRSRLPDWFWQHVKAPCFLLLPLTMKHQGKEVSMGLIYADQVAVDGFQITQQELALLRTLRNQAVMAFRQTASL